MPLGELVTLNKKKLPLYGHTDSKNRGRNIVITGNFSRKCGLVHILPEAKHSDRYRSHHREITNLISFPGEGTIRADGIKAPRAHVCLHRDQCARTSWLLASDKGTCWAATAATSVAEMEQGAAPLLRNHSKDSLKRDWVQLPTLCMVAAMEHQNRRKMELFSTQAARLPREKGQREGARSANNRLALVRTRNWDEKTVKNSKEWC